MSLKKVCMKPLSQKPEEVSKVKFMFIRNDEEFPVGCLAYEIDRKRYNDEEDVVRYAFSVHHLKDKFSKKIAKRVAEGRLNKKPIEFRPDIENAHPRDLLHDVCWEIHKAPAYYASAIYSESPSWVKRFRSALTHTMDRLGKN